MKADAKKILLVTALFFFLCAPWQAQAGVAVTSGLTHEQKALPGETYKGLLTLFNNGDSPQEVKVYQKDYLFYADGSNIYGDPGKDPRSNAKWITYSPYQVVVPPKTSVNVYYSVAVPDDKSLAGTYWSLMMIENAPSSNVRAPKQEEGKVTLGITQVVRFAAQIRTQIEDTGVRKLKFNTPQLKKDEKGSFLEIDLENIGERYLKTLLSVELYDNNGKSMGKFDGGGTGLYPATSARFKARLGNIPKGKYKALVIADGGGDDMFGSTYALEFE